jgi:hypothetical protein
VKQRQQTYRPPRAVPLVQQEHHPHHRQEDEEEAEAVGEVDAAEAAELQTEEEAMRTLEAPVQRSKVTLME